MNGHCVGDEFSFIPATSRSLETFNPIRNIVDQMVIEPNVNKKLIPLSIGDPTTFGNLPVSEATKKAMMEVIQSDKCNGYGPSDGFGCVKTAIAQFYSIPESPLTPNDVMLTSSCSGALDIAIGALAEEGTNIVVPRPGFSIYGTLSTLYKVNVKYYNLLPDSNWEIDLEHLESVIDQDTSALVVCNPSNPCGSVWSHSHICRIVALAGRHHLPIIADEIYADMVFAGIQFTSFRKASHSVPVLVVGGLAKRWLVPGWRVGWIIIHDRLNQFKFVRNGLRNLSQRILGPNSLCQMAIPTILSETSQEYYQNVMTKVERNAKHAFSVLSKTPGLAPVMPSGAMYMMVGVDPSMFTKSPDEVFDDLIFTQALVREQSVFCLPGVCFQYPNYFRIVLTVPFEMMSEACSRIDEFCRSLATISS